MSLSARRSRLRMVPEAIVIEVRGRPEPGGSKSAFPLPNRNYVKGMPPALRFLHDGSGRPLINVTDANPKVKAWMKMVATAANVQYNGPMLDGPLIVEMSFVTGRPKGHYRTGKNAKLLRGDAPLYPITRPDALKLARSTEDALTGVVWTDDTRTVDLVIHQRYIDGYALEGDAREGVVIKILQHEYRTVGEAVAGAQGSFLAA